jgi:hypothetical protein
MIDYLWRWPTGVTEIGCQSFIGRSRGTGVLRGKGITERLRRGVMGICEWKFRVWGRGEGRRMVNGEWESGVGVTGYGGYGEGKGIGIRGGKGMGVCRRGSVIECAGGEWAVGGEYDRV